MTHPRYKVRLLPMLAGLFWLVIGIFTATSPRIAPKILRWNYIFAWMILFGLPCLFLLRLSIHQVNTDVPEQEIKSLYTDRYRQTFPQLSEEEAELQETHEIGFKNGESQGDSNSTHSLSSVNGWVLTREQADMIKRVAEEEKKKRKLQREG